MQTSLVLKLEQVKLQVHKLSLTTTKIQQTEGIVCLTRSRNPFEVVGGSCVAVESDSFSPLIRRSPRTLRS